MKKTIFKGTVNGTKYDNVVDYNKAVQAALKEGKNVEASSSTQITDVPEEGSCKKQMAYVPKQERKCNGPEIDFNFKGMMNKNADELAEALEQLTTNFKQLPNDYKESLLHIIKDAKAIAERQMKATEKDVDVIDAQLAEIQNQMDKLEEQYDKLEEQYDKFGEKADQLEEQHNKLSMIVGCIDDIVEENDHQKANNDVSTMTDLWKALFGA